MDKLNQTLDAFTAGLRSDPEVQLDVRQQMKSIFEEKIAEETAKGHSREECIDLAINAIGPTDEVANFLVSANLKRMKSRLRMRFVIRLLLIPAVVICAVLTLYWSSDIMVTKSFFNSIDADFEFSIRLSQYLIFDRWTPEQELILLGCQAEDEYSARQKGIWKEYPDNKIYAANYILSLLRDDEDSTFVLAEIEKAKTIDPDNAFYNYIAAGIMLNDACDEKEISAGGKNHVYRFEVKDRTLLEKAVREYLGGTKKKCCYSYNGDVLKIRRKYFGEFHSLAEQFEWLSLSSKTLTPKFNYKSIAKFLPEYANILIDEGKKDEALRCLNSWKKYLEHINACFNGNSILDALIIDYIARIDKEKLPPLYERLGLHKLAQDTKAEAENICAPVAAWKEKKEKIRIGNSKKFSERGGIFASMLLPVFGEFTDEELAPERYAEYVFMKKIEMAVFNIYLIYGIIFALGFVLCFRLRTGRLLLTLMPPPGMVIKIIGISIILPYVLYCLYSKIEILSGYNLSLATNSLHYALQSWFLYVLMITVMVVLSKKYVVTRCKELNVEIPPGINKYPKILWLIALGWFALGMFIPIYMVTGNLSKIISFVNVAAHVVISVVIIWYALYLIWILLFSKKEYWFYYGALAKIMILNFALAVIVLSFIFRPLLNMQEAYFIKKDQIMFGSTGILTKAEEKLTMELKDAISAAISKDRK
ncbi:MAG: hypothetical protein ACYC2P_13500 [Paludibacteraceae bacterium]